MEIEKLGFISDFLSEFTGELDSLESEIFYLRRHQADKKSLSSIILHIQNMKSIASVMEFLRIKNILSKLYELFENIREERIKLSNDIVRLFINISEQLRITLKNIENGESDTVNFYDFIDLNLQKAVNKEPFCPEFNQGEDKDSSTENLLKTEENYSIYVNIGKIDEVLQNFDKLIMQEFRLKKLLYEIFDLNDSQFIQKNSRKIRQIKENIELIENQSSSLQDNVISMRKLSFNMVLQPFKRACIAEVLKRNLNVVFDIPLTDIKIDKSILERIPFILRNIIINSVEHGIETKEERLDLGKNENGLISVNVKQMLNRIILTVSDDGRGIDFNKIKDLAVFFYPENEENILNLQPKELIEYLFKPGISTKNKQENECSYIYGKGLKEVREEIDNIKGKIKIESTKNKGTVFEISMPLSLATQEGLFVTAGKYKLLILSHYIKEILYVKNDSFISIQSETVISVDNELIPVYNSKAIFGEGDFDSYKTELSVVILEYLEIKVAVVIDSILNYATVVIKTLPPIFRKSKALQGIVFDEDYKIVPILNIPDLIGRFRNMNEYEIKKFEVRNAKKSYSVLIADSSLTTRQIEEDIFETEHYSVAVCKDGIEALEKAKNFHFDLIVTDITMPRMDGYVFIHNIRHMPEYENIPIIVLSSDLSGEEQKILLNNGVQAYISKTNFKRENLIKTAKRLLND